MNNFTGKDLLTEKLVEVGLAKTCELAALYWVIPLLFRANVREHVFKASFKQKTSTCFQRL